jgi:hypothetical protein
MAEAAEQRQRELGIAAHRLDHGAAAKQQHPLRRAYRIVASQWQRQIAPLVRR